MNDHLPVWGDEAIRRIREVTTILIESNDIAQKIEEQRNEGARMADDYFCTGCGKRGIFGKCQECER